MSLGSELADRVWAIVQPHIDPYSRQEIAKEFVDAFEELDADPLWGTQLEEDLNTEPCDIEDDWSSDDDHRWDDDDDYFHGDNYWDDDEFDGDGFAGKYDDFDDADKEI